MPDLRYLFSQLGDPRSILDVLAVSLIVFGLLSMAQGTRANQLIRGILILLVGAFVLGAVLQLTALSWVLRQAWPAVLVAIPVIFAPELRRALEQLGTTRAWLPQLGQSATAEQDRMVDELVRAAAQLARNRYGALMVLERQTGLQNYVERGVPIDAYLTRQLLINIFYPNSPLHDGAVVIRGDRILAASVVLPLTDNISATSQLGTRHRAAIGVTEVSDALAVVVSEETGQIALAHNGRLVRNLDQDRLRLVLRSLLRLDQAGKERPGFVTAATERLGLGGRDGAPAPGRPAGPARPDAEPTKMT
ncbi:MAG: diadenylate cyclase CdaA [Chloroflexota bacterium]